MKVRITECLEIDLDKDQWCCQGCGFPLIGARENYKKGCLVAERPLEEVHPPLVEGQALQFLPGPGVLPLAGILLPGLREIAGK